MKHISESTHYYWPDGRPAYEVESADGKKMIPTTLTQARRLGLYPSVTTIISQLAKNAVTNWLLGIVYEECYNAQLEFKINSCDIYRKKVSRKVQKRKDEGAKLGSKIHAHLENYFMNNRKPTGKVSSISMKAIRAIGEEVGTSAVHDCEMPFASPAGYGGCIDDIIGFNLLCDYKTTSDKQFSKLCKNPYPSWGMQLGAYVQPIDPQLDWMTCVSIIINRDTGETFFYNWKREDILKQWQIFNYLLKVWYLTRNIPLPLDIITKAV